MRALKFAGAFLGALIVIFLIIFGTNLNALLILFENHGALKEGQEWVEKTHSLKGLTEYIAAQPEHVSVVSLASDNPDSSISYNGHTPRTMGRLANLFVLAEYVRQTEEGQLDPDEAVPYAHINRYQLPYMDATDHQDALARLREWSDGSSDSTVALKHVVEAAVRFNDTAIADYLLFRLGPDRIEALMDQLGIARTESPLPFSGLYITLNPHLQQRSTEAHFDSLSALSRLEFSRLVYDNSARLRTDDDFHRRVNALFEEEEGLGITFDKQRDGLAFFPKTTAHEMAGLMEQLQQNRLLSPALSKRLKQILDWPLQSGRLQGDFETYGALYDNRMGMASGIDFGASSYSGEPFAQAVFFDELQVAFWFHMSSSLMHQDFQQRLIWDPALRAATVQQISNPNPDTAAQ